jgi:hypothetical protein
VSLLHAEYLKLSRRRLYYTMVLILAALVGLLAFFLLIFGQIAPEIAEGVPVVRKPEAYLFGAQQVAGQTWFPLILSVVMLGSEFGSTVWATALTRDPRRTIQVGARFAVLAAASLLAVGAGIAGWALVTAVAVPGEGGPELSEWLGPPSGSVRWPCSVRWGRRSAPPSPSTSSTRSWACGARGRTYRSPRRRMHCSGWTSPVVSGRWSRALIWPYPMPSASWWDGRS